MTIEELIGSSNAVNEGMVLSDILVTGMMPLDLRPEYFTGKQRKLFDALYFQWSEFGELNPEILSDGEKAIADEVLSLNGNSSKEIIESLHSEYLRRCHGLMMYESMKIEEPDASLRALQESIADALFSKRSKDYDHLDNMRRLMAALERATQMDIAVSGVTTGVPQYDALINGHEHGKVYVIGALKKTGKSRFMTQCAISACEAGAGVIVNSLEMSPIRLNNLALSYYSGVNGNKIGRALTQGDFSKIAAATDKLRSLSWKIYADHTVADMRSRIIHEKAKGQVDVVFVDFIQRLRDDKYGKDRVREVERISQDLADLAREQDVAMVEVTQLKGEAEFLQKRGDKKPGVFGGGEKRESDEDHMPDMSYVKESQGISENADVITILHNPKRHENPYDGAAYVLPTLLCKVEQRDDVSGTVLRLAADLRTCRFTICD